MSLRKLATKANPNCDQSENDDEKAKKQTTVALGNGSEVVLIPRFISFDRAWSWFDYLNTKIPWTRPTVRVFGRSCLQPRDTCYVASPGLPHLVYSGYQPHAYSWDDLPPLKELLEAVHKALPGSSFNSLLLNRYKGGNDYVAWHSDDEKVYGSTPEIASLSFGCEREFFLKKKPSKTSQEGKSDQESSSKRLKRNHDDQHSFMLKHGSLLVMRGYTQRDWMHSVPKRTKLEATRINLTFRLVHKALPGSSFNSLLLNRYKGGNDYVAWHSDDEKVYGSTPEIASLSFGCEREFFLKKKPSKTSQEGKSDQESSSKRLKRNHDDQHSFMLKHGSLLVMRGYTQRDWMHSVPKRTKLEATRINLTFRLVL